MKAGRPEEAEPLLPEALERLPDDPGLLNNLTVALEAQGCHKEARAIMADEQRRFPEYFFGQLWWAHEQMHRGEFEGAAAALEQLSARPRYHISEYAALCAAHAHLAVAQQRQGDAEQWLDMLEQVDPDHIELPSLRRIQQMGSSRWKPGPPFRFRTSARKG